MDALFQKTHCIVVFRNKKENNLISLTFQQDCQPLVIPFVVGPRSPSGLQAQLQAEERLQEQLANAPRALEALIAINICTVLNRSKEIKAVFAEEFMDFNDRVLENYSLLLTMAAEVSGHH